jgi:hypothetical protein
LESLQFSEQLLKEFENDNNVTDSLQLQITDSHIVIAATQNEFSNPTYNRKIKVMKVPITGK